METGEIIGVTGVIIIMGSFLVLAIVMAYYEITENIAEAKDLQ